VHVLSRLAARTAPALAGLSPCLALGAGEGAGWEKVRALQCPGALSQAQSTLRAMFEEPQRVSRVLPLPGSI